MHSPLNNRNRGVARGALSRRLLAFLVAPGLLAAGIVATAAAPASAAPTAQVPVAGTTVLTESFSGSTTSDAAWRAFGGSCLTHSTAVSAADGTALGGCATHLNAPDATADSGYLQLTDSTYWARAGVVNNTTFASKNGLDVTFDQYQFGSGYGGDGLSFFLANGAADVTTIGGLGSSLGYAQNKNQPAAPNGINGGYLGLGLDAFGAFTTGNDGHGTGCAAAEPTITKANSIVLRGPGQAKIGYCFLSSVNLDPTTQSLRTKTAVSTPTAAMARHIRVVVSADVRPTVTVYAAFPASGPLARVLQYTMTDAAPATYKLGFAAGTGSTTDTHLISNLTVATVVPLDTTAPVVTITGGAAVVTKATAATISGSTDEPAGTAVTVTVAGQTLKTTVAAGGTWSVTPVTLAEGSYPVVVSITDTAGNTGTATQTLTVDKTAPVVTITGGSGTVTTSNATPVISGTTTESAGSTVTVTVSGQTLTTKVLTGGTWSVTPATLAVGCRTVTASITDAAGNTGKATQTLKTTAPVVVPPVVVQPVVVPPVVVPAAPWTTNYNAPVIQGTTDAAVGTQVQVTISGQVFTTQVLSGGLWGVRLNQLNNGTYTVVVSARNAAGATGSATQQLIIDTNALAPAASAGSACAPLSTNGEVTVNLASTSLTASVHQYGVWAMAPAKSADCAYAVVPSVADPSGNTGTFSRVLVAGGTAPAVTITGGATAVADPAAPTIAGTTTAPAGSSVLIRIDGQMLSTQVTNAGTWSVYRNSLNPGSHQLVVSVTTATGSTGYAAQTLTAK
ncbi:Ig-like domain-containing protein [Cryobacterium sp. RTS3]|uniref:Ig-like domain-containing protein n=1 Tax=Cryobacterium sp. RTS3 TaxID=3048643 RepID=UPI002B22FE2E|nr:Ig-like domain-containing protein [Cryobacterium sp. RTS3]MEA9999986.1 Ig-like domain-containing protein [Cryobacterium sp. RTS3]